MATEMRVDGTLPYFTQLEIIFNIFYIRCTTWKSNINVFHTIRSHFVQEEILTLGKGITSINQRHQIEYGVKV